MGVLTPQEVPPKKSPGGFPKRMWWFPREGFLLKEFFKDQPLKDSSHMQASPSRVILLGNPLGRPISYIALTHIVSHNVAHPL